MKKIVIVLLTTIVVLILSIAIYIGLNSNFISAGTPRVFVIPVSGNTAYRQPREAEFKEITKGIQIVEGSEIQLGDDGLAVIILQDNSVILLTEYTKLQLLRLPSKDSGTAYILQTNGVTWHNLSTDRKEGEYEVVSSRTIASCTGNFRVDVREGLQTTSVSTTKETCKLNLADRSLASPILLSEGYTINFSAGNSAISLPETSQINNELKSSPDFEQMERLMDNLELVYRSHLFAKPETLEQILRPKL